MGGPILTSLLYAITVILFLASVLGQSFIGRFIGWFFALLLLITSISGPLVPSKLIPLYSPQRFGLGILFLIVSYAVVSVTVTKAYMVRVQQVSVPEDYLHSVSSFACQRELKESVRFWQWRLGPFVIVVSTVVYVSYLVAVWAGIIA
jgi:hypothetical protein